MSENEPTKITRQDPGSSNPQRILEQNYQLLIRKVEDPESPVEEIIECLQVIPELSMSIIRRANSSEFSLKHQVSRLEHAIAVLGSLRTLATINKHRHAAETKVRKPHFNKSRANVSKAG